MREVVFLDVGLELLRELFKDLHDRYQCASCNEKEIPSTPEMNLLVAIAEKEWYDKEGVPESEQPEVHVVNGNIRTMDFMVFDYFKKKLGVKI